ncbi:S49 family peptidase [Roseateles sp. SL47]|uniref:S49 family peptidase n=1 Tax=Roseateles sp. SL47 TaxID=2995138 RepID=UPI002271D4CE|nr:S49 family peptidase [Roseateles sp. SL47]WAC75017.1 S49 family peptidase [Roseateles sp. SL47]
MNQNPNDLPPPIPDATARPEDMFRAGPATGHAAGAAPRPYEQVLEQFAHDYLRDRRSERRWKLFFRLIWASVVLLLVWGMFSQRHHTGTTTGPHTALVDVRGEISADTEASAELIVSALKNAFEDPGSVAVVLRMNSPGGSPVQAGIVNDEIRRLKALHNKKVYVVVEEMCASGAYYIAAGADEIYVDKASIVGSIGVLMDGFGFTGLMQKVGVERRLMTAGDNKGMLDPFSPVSAKQQAYAQAMLDQIHQQFIKVVREGRGDRLKETPETFSGLFWNGEQAVKMGLADGTGNLDYVAREVIKAEEVVDYTPRDNVAERLAKRFGAAMGAGAVKTLRETTSIR